MGAPQLQYAIPAGGGVPVGVSGVGTVNLLTKWSAATTIADSGVSDDGTTVSFVARNLSSSAAQTWALATSTSALNIQSGLLNLDTTNSRIGIGTTSPGRKLVVNDTAAECFLSVRGVVGGSSGLLLGDTTTEVLGVVRAFTSGAGIYLGAGNNQHLSINSSGNVGIGTASPAGRLHVVGGTAAAATNGAPVTIIAQTAGSGNQNGGNIVLTPGALSGSGTAGLVDLSGPTGTGIKLPSSPGNADTQTLDCYNEIATQTTGATFTGLTLVSTGLAPTSYSITTTRIGRTVNILVSVSSSGSVFAGTALLFYVNLSGVTGIPTGTLDAPVPICHNGTAAIAGNTGIWYNSTRQILAIDPTASGGPTTIIFSLTTYIA